MHEMASNKGKLPEDSTRRRVQDVLGQARAALRMSQQFRTRDDRNNNLSSRLAFQQQPHEPDYWSSIAEPEKRETDKSSTYPHERDGLASRKSTKTKKYDDFGPFGPQSISHGKKNEASSSSPVASHGKRRSSFASQVSSSSSITMNTNDLMVSDSDSPNSDSERSISSMKRAPVAKKLVSTNIKTSEKPITTPAPSLVTHSESIAASSVKGEHHEEEDNGKTPVPPSATTTIPDEMGKQEEMDQQLTYDQILSMKQNVTGDPHWFEKALLIRGESISEAAYKAFKKVHAEQEAQQERIMKEIDSMSKHSVFNPLLMDPEYSADWISDAPSTSMGTRVQSEMDMTGSEYIVQEIEDDDDDEIEIDASTVGHSDTISFIRTATELEASGVLDVIAENIQQILEISEVPESQDFTQIAGGGTGEDVNANENTLGEDEDYESTFLTTKSSKKQSSKSQSFSVAGGKSKELSSKSKSKTGSVIQPSKSKSKSTSAPSVSTSKSKSTSAAAASPTSSFRRKSSLPPGQTLDPPSTRQQKNIQTILEKEVYEKELKRLRAEKLKEERDNQRLKRLAKKSLEDNKKVTYKEPDYTEILLPELFKYKSVSGLQAAKAKRTNRKVSSPTTINYGAPYFSTSGAVSSANNYGINSMAAQWIA
ncbi:hypothetical protein Ocin01_14462 [Orchesella cincta]|uniref:Uncharacterized protein n=1 Tax=Orchesella cincta TaxID=48709 RepID=A0A1D2MGU0_ORCCI|nr:hypothetical protein Ocin01_14462 [Orchesella cincta]